jgi:serine/threonine-protein kinase RsbW
VSDRTSTSTTRDDPARPPRGAPSGSAPGVRLRLPAVPSNMALVRQALAGFADSLGLDGTRAADMKIAITEACTNAVVHAYGEEGGPLEVAMTAQGGRLVLSVRDRGHGLRPFPASGDGPPLGFGLALIASLSDEFGIAGGRHGTEVRMAFAFGEDGTGTDAPLTVQVPPEEMWPANDTVLVLAPGDHAAPVLSRVVSLVAARADFSIDRLSDAQIVSDAIAGAAGPYTADGALQIAIDEREHSFDLLIGPLVAGGGAQLVRDTDLPGLGCLLERLADALAVEPVGSPQAGELLRATLGTRD